MKTNNKQIGNSFESELCELLSQNGFWAYNAVNKSSGQPADVLAARNDVPYLIDCKVCSNDTFPLSRIEENQYNAMMLFNARGNEETYFALKFSDGVIYMLSAMLLFSAMNAGVKSLHRRDIEENPYGCPFERWVEKCD